MLQNRVTRVLSGAAVSMAVVTPADAKLAEVEPLQPSSFQLRNEMASLEREAAASGTGSDGFGSLVLEIANQERDRLKKATQEAGVALSNEEMIAAIRSSLALQIKELAEILDVKRATIYSWINEESQPSASNRRKLQRVYDIALAWNKCCNLPADKLLRATGSDGKSVLEMLQSNSIDVVAIVERFPKLAAKRHDLQAEQANKHKKRTTGRTRSAESRARLPDLQDQIDTFTGKRSHAG